MLSKWRSPCWYETLIRSSTNRFAAGAVHSMEIGGTGIRDVETNAPQKAKGASATLNNGVTINGALVVGTTNVMNVINSKETSFDFTAHLSKTAKNSNTLK